MLYLGHIGIAVFLASMLYLPIIFAVIGVLLPDIVDKGLYMLGIVPCSRYFAHSIFFPLVVGSIVFLVTRRWKLALAITFGSLLHLFQDMHWVVPWFFPLISYPEILACGPIKVNVNLFIIVTEVIGAGLLVFTLGFRQKFIYLRRKFWGLLMKIKKK